MLSLREGCQLTNESARQLWSAVLGQLELEPELAEIVYGGLGEPVLVDHHLRGEGGRHVAGGVHDGEANPAGRQRSEQPKHDILQSAIRGCAAVVPRLEEQCCAPGQRCEGREPEFRPLHPQVVVRRRSSFELVQSEVVLAEQHGLQYRFSPVERENNYSPNTVIFKLELGKSGRPVRDLKRRLMINGDMAVERSDDALMHSPVDILDAATRLGHLHQLGIPVARRHQRLDPLDAGHPRPLAEQLVIGYGPSPSVGRERRAKHARSGAGES